jgi:uncharacterized membrane protein
MYRKILDYFSDNKYRMMSSSCWRKRRSSQSWPGAFGIQWDGAPFLIWNLFLAWIPFIIAYFTYTLTLQRKWVFVVIPVAAFFWMIFFPNAPYILTDFQHLAGEWADLPVWYDVMMLIWFAFTGLLLGMVSLFLMQEIIRREFGRWVGWGFVMLVTSLSSAGIYMGRFLRWNSWDIILNPSDIALYTIQSAQDPSLQSVGFMGLFAAFFLFLYTFGHLLLEASMRLVGAT